MPVLVVRISDQEGTDLLANTVTNFSGGKFYELFEKCVESKDIILSVDSMWKFVCVKDKMPNSSSQIMLIWTFQK